MSLHDDLLRQADDLATGEPNKPRQASLRRAVSAAYYAMFHLLAAEGSRFVVRSADRPELRRLAGRAFRHTDISIVAERFRSGALTKMRPALRGGPVPDDLQHVAAAFVDLQAARHAADYDVGARFTRRLVIDHVETAKRAFEAWSRVRATPAADAFLLALLLERHIQTD